MPLMGGNTPESETPSLQPDAAARQFARTFGFEFIRDPQSAFMG